MTIIDQIIRDTQAPTNEAGAQAAIRHRDETWWGQAMAGIGLLASTGESFDAYTLQSVGVGEPDHPNRYGALFLSAAHAGVIEKVGYHRSKRPGRSGGVCAVWRGRQP